MVVIVIGEILAAIEFCAKGDLLNFLIKQRTNFHNVLLPPTQRGLPGCNDKDIYRLCPHTLYMYLVEIVSGLRMLYVLIIIYFQRECCWEGLR